MKRWWMLMVWFVSLPGWATTYAYGGPTYIAILNHTTCVKGPCGDYSSAMRVTGSFTTPVPLGANLVSVDISGTVTGFSFNDGLQTFASSDPDVSVQNMIVSTDGAGVVTGWTIQLFRWNNGSSGAHVIGDGVNMVQVVSVTGDRALFNFTCTAVDLQDHCTSPAASADASQAVAAAGGWTLAGQANVAHPTPTLSQWALMLLSLLTAALALVGGGRRMWGQSRNSSAGGSFRH